MRICKPRCAVPDRHGEGTDRVPTWEGHHGTAASGCRHRGAQVGPGVSQGASSLGWDTRVERILGIGHRRQVPRDGRGGCARHPAISGGRSSRLQRISPGGGPVCTSGWTPMYADYYRTPGHSGPNRYRCQHHCAHHPGTARRTGTIALRAEERGRPTPPRPRPRRGR